MAKSYITKNFKLHETPQSEPLEGQVANSAGGYSYQVDKWKQLERFLVLGSESGTYYISEQKLTRDNVKNVISCIKENGVKTINVILRFSKEGRVPKVNTVLFAHALASIIGDERTRREAFATLSGVARIGTHLFQWLQFRKDLEGGYGSGVRKALANWYNDKPAEQLGYQLIKYKQRDGWNHLDVLRLCHANPVSEAHNNLFHYAKYCAGKAEIPISLPEQVAAAEELKNTKKQSDIIKLIVDYKLPREVIPTEYLVDPAIWEALFQDMPMTAMIRNLGNMSKVGFLKANSKAAKEVVARLDDSERLQKARVHPIQLLSALKTYGSGKGLRGSGEWNSVSTVTDALEGAFYKSFKFIEPTGKRFLLGVDVSASMGWGNVAGLEGLTPAEGAAVMAMVTARTEANYEVRGFSHTLVDLGITAKDSLEYVLQKTRNSNFGGTDCSLPMQWALKNKIDVDTFVVYTDNETWCGNIHPSEALNKYRKAMNIPAKLAVVAFTGNKFSIADPSDAGMIDFVGFDSAAPAVLTDFSRN